MQPPPKKKNSGKISVHVNKPSKELLMLLLLYHTTITEQMKHELKGLPDDAEHKEIANDYMKYLSRMDMRLDRVWKTYFMQCSFCRVFAAVTIVCVCRLLKFLHIHCIQFSICKLHSNIFLKCQTVKVRSHVTFAFQSTFKFNVVPKMQTQRMGVKPVLCVCVWVTITIMVKFYADIDVDAKLSETSLNEYYYTYVILESETMARRDG